MIFVTVGTFNFDALIKHVDTLAHKGVFKDNEVICQIGSGEYLPKHCQHFRYEKNLTHYYQTAEFIICHGGTGSTTDCIRMNKPFIAIAHKELADNHQTEFLQALSKECDFCWTDDPLAIPELYQKAKQTIIHNRIPTLCSDLNRYLSTIHSNI